VYFFGFFDYYVIYFSVVTFATA